MKKTIVNGIFSVIVAAITACGGYYAGGQQKEREFENQINQVVNVDNGDIASSINTLVEENKQLHQEVDSLEEKLSAYEQGENGSDTEENFPADQQQRLLEGVPENATELKDLPEVAADNFEVETPFTDSYGNRYETGYKFDASFNGYAVFGLKGEYKTFSAVVVCGQDTSPGADMEILVYKNDDELLGTISHVDKTTETLVIGPYDITDARNLTIKTSNEGSFAYGMCSLVNAYVE